MEERVDFNGEKFYNNEYGASNIVLGICAMDGKARSRGMSELLKNLISFGQIEIIIFGEDTIVNEPVENWAPCNYLIAFYSDGFPIEKAIKYCELRKPFLLNDLHSQIILMDRRKVYKTLETLGIPNPKHLVLDRESANPSVWQQGSDWIEVDGLKMFKPFIEKPVLADDHNNYIYYSSSQGGGCRKLFRKTTNESSRFYPDQNNVRESSSYIYQEFLEPYNFTDVKVYAAGNYIYAEERKAPTADGKVDRSDDGSELRTTGTLTEEEKQMVKCVTDAFQQTVCGIDILRTSEGSFVIDVNGWSFVKGKGAEQLRYYQIAASELYSIMKQHQQKQRYQQEQQPQQVPCLPVAHEEQRVESCGDGLQTR